MDQAEIELASGERAIVGEIWVTALSGNRATVAGKDVRLARWIRTPVVTVSDDCPIPDNLHDTKAYFQERLQRLLADAARVGIVITVDLQPLEPLAMRSYRMVGNVRGAR